MHAFYPDLQIVPMSHLKLQENVQRVRMQSLARVIKKDGVLRHPPIATNFFNSTYLEIDGANRITAIDLLGYKKCLVQLVDYSDSEHVHLTSWSHLTDLKKSTFLTKVKKISGIQIIPHKVFDHRWLLKPHVLCVAQFADRSIYELNLKTAFTTFVGAIGKIVALYKDAPVERVFSAHPWDSQSIHVRFERHPEHNVFFAFPTFSPSQVMNLIDRGVLMPPGLTRHVVFRRKLNINMPLSFLRISSLEKANEELQKFLQHRTVRLYEEPVIYFE